MDIDLASLDGALKVLGQLLADRGYHYEVAVIGGGSLLLLGLIDRTTRDLDLVALVRGRELISAIPLPHPLVQAAEEVGRALDLGKGWLNIGPASLMELGLPPGFMERLHVRKYQGLTVYLADRFDQICLKLYASVDQGPQSKHFTDLKALKPSTKELQQAKNWCITHDVSADFEKDVNRAIESIDAIN
jgi:Nucleotidyltransferase of unknown function (DUF6036)